MSDILNGIEASAIVAQLINERCYTYTSIPQLTQINIWNLSVMVIEHNSLQDPVSHVVHSLADRHVTTAFLSSASLMSAIPYLYKLAADKSSAVLHVSANSNNQPSFFADYTQIMSVRQSGFALLSSSTVQEAHDLSLVAQWVSLLTSTPFLHFFDSKRISHEYSSIQLLDRDTLVKCLPQHLVDENCKNKSALPNVFKQSAYLTYKASSEKKVDNIVDNEMESDEQLDIFDTVKNVMDQFASVTGRSYFPLEYSGHLEAELVIVAMGAGATVVEQTMSAMMKSNPTQKIGALKIRLYRPWSDKLFLGSLPPTVQGIAVLEPTYDYTSTWNPLFLDVAAAYQNIGNDSVDIVNGQYGVEDVDLSPAMVRAVYDGLSAGNLDRHFGVSTLPISSQYIEMFEPSTVEQVIFVGDSSLAMSYAQKSNKKVQVYTLGITPITHVRLFATTFKPPLPSLIQNADAVVIDSVPVDIDDEQAAIEAIHSLTSGGHIILGCVESVADLDTLLSAGVKKAAYDKQAKLTLVKDLYGAFNKNCCISGMVTVAKSFVSIGLPAHWANSQSDSLLSPPSQLKQRKVQAIQPVETPYIKMLDQFFGPRLNLANSLHSTSIWSNDGLPATDHTTTVEYGYGRLVNYIQERGRFVDSVIKIIRDESNLPTDALRILSQWLMLVNSPQSLPQAINETAELASRVLATYCPSLATAEKIELLYEKSNWLIGSDSWAYDLGQSGLHHVITSGDNINLLIVDTTPYTSQVDREQRKKDIGLYAMNYASVYVASVALYASYTGVLQAFIEADAYKGPSIVITYLPQLSDTLNPLESLKETKICVDNGMWPLYRWNPALEQEGQEMFSLDSQRIKRDLQEFLARENYLTQLVSCNPDISTTLVGSLQNDVKKRHSELKAKARADYARLLSGLGSTNGAPLTVLFGSDNGNAEGIAKKIATRAKSRGLQVKLMAMDDYGDITDLANEVNLLIICSSASQGEMPSNAREFWKSLNGLIVGDINLSEVHVGVFGLGDSHYWPHEEDAHFYNRPGKLLDAKFDTLGALKLVPLGLADDQDEDGFETGLASWLPQLWKALGVKDIGAEDDNSAPAYTDNHMKLDSNYLRGDIAQDIVDDSTGAVSEISQKLIKFHGAYLQDDRDLREERKKQGLEKAYSFLIRVRTPGGVASPKQWLVMDNLADKYGNKTLKLTTRQAFQLHGVLKRNLRTTIRQINKSLLTTFGACGDVNRNLMSTAITEIPEIHGQVQETLLKLTDLLAPKTTAYHEIWLDNSMVAGRAVQDFEPIYGPPYLPRKFKIVFAVPPNNDVDVYAHDLGYVAIVDHSKKQVIGYNVLIGGGMGQTHGSKKTYPRPGSLIGYIPVDAIVDVTKAVVETQRDYGDRVNRKRARFKYTIDDLGLDFIKKEIENRSGILFEEARPFEFNDNVDRYGWTKGLGDTWNFCLFIENGRVKDTPDFPCKTGLRELAKFHKGEFRLTANQHLVICNIPEADLEKTKAHLAKYKLDNLSHSGIRKTAMACVALPTCGLAMAESERYLPDLITKFEEIMEEAGLRDDVIVVRMTGCPNGCARPYLAELAFVGKAPDTYNMYLGGSSKGERLNKLYMENLQEEAILKEVRPMIKKYAVERSDNESFGDWVIRAGYVKKTITGTDFHDLS